MTQRSRYLLILLGLLTFLVAAPLIILYVKGVSFDFTSGNFVETGILAVRSRPELVDVYLNDKLVRRREGDIRFLAPGEYRLDLKKEGYKPWSKRITIQSGQVSWAGKSFEDVYLFLENPKVTNIQNGVLDFFAEDDRIVYLTSKEIAVENISDAGSKRAYPLPFEDGRIISYDIGGENFVVTGSAGSSLLLFNSTFGEIHDLSGLFKGVTELQFDQDGSLYALSEEILYKIDAENKTKTQIFKDIKGFHFLESRLYLITGTKDLQTYSLSVSQEPFNGLSELAKGIPQFEGEAKVFVSYEKQAFILAGGNIYLAGPAMQKVAGNVSYWVGDLQNSSLAILHSGQLDYYDTSEKKFNLITRSSEKLEQAFVSQEVLGAFFVKKNALTEIELDARSGQNEYVLYQGSNIQRFFVNNNASSAMVLDSGEIKRMDIR